jgi:hypothetical protein
MINTREAALHSNNWKTVGWNTPGCLKNPADGTAKTPTHYGTSKIVSQCTMI